MKFFIYVYPLRSRHILYFVLLVRFFYLKSTRGIKVIESPYSINISNTHNLDGLNNHFKGCVLMDRFDRLMHCMLANEIFNKKCKILIIGPRTEADIFKLKAYEYSNIVAIDLISYSESITLMDCHQMTFKDNTFDAIFCGWVLPYSKNPQKIADNIIRVAKKKALIAIGVEYSRRSSINSIDKIKSLFRNKVGNIFFEYNACLKDHDPMTLEKNTSVASSQVMISFSVKK